MYLCLKSHGTLFTNINACNMDCDFHESTGPKIERFHMSIIKVNKSWHTVPSQPHNGYHKYSMLGTFNPWSVMICWKKPPFPIEAMLSREPRSVKLMAAGISCRSVAGNWKRHWQPESRISKMIRFLPQYSRLSDIRLSIVFLNVSYD